jgi:hypothetical protein
MTHLKLTAHKRTAKWYQCRHHVFQIVRRQKITAETAPETSTNFAKQMSMVSGTANFFSIVLDVHAVMVNGEYLLLYIALSRDK